MTKDTIPLHCDSPSGEQLDDPSQSFQPSHEQVLEDAKLAKVLQDWENKSECFDDIPDHSTNVLTKPSQIVELLAGRVHQTQDFFPCYAPYCTLYKDTCIMAKAGPKNSAHQCSKSTLQWQGRD